VNRAAGVKRQQLWACKIQFAFKDAGPLSYLSGKAFEIEPSFDI